MWWIYLIETLGVIKWVSFIFILIILTFLGVLFIAWSSAGDGDSPKLRKTFKYGFISICFCTICAIFIPSKHSMYLMAGAHFVEQMDTEKLKALPDKTVDVLNKALDKLNKELE